MDELPHGAGRCMHACTHTQGTLAQGHTHSGHTHTQGKYAQGIARSEARMLLGGEAFKMAFYWEKEVRWLMFNKQNQS